MKLFSKIIGIGIAGLLTAIAIAVISIYIETSSTKISNEIRLFQACKNEFTGAKLRHRDWERIVSKAIIIQSPSLEINVNGRECLFGKWYYGPAQEIVKTLPSDMQDAFHDIEKDHLDIHLLGGELVDKWGKDSHEECTKYHTSNIMPLADIVVGKLALLEELFEEKIIALEQQEDWYLKYGNMPVFFTLVASIITILPYSCYTARGISLPMRQSCNLFQDIAKRGNLQVAVPESALRRKDEIGDLARSVSLLLADLHSMAKTLKELADGDWSVTVQEKSPDDAVNQDFSTMLGQMNKMLHEIRQSTQQISTGSSEVASTAQHLSSGAQESAASLEQISASMNEISSQTKTNAESAGKARDLAQKTSKAAVEGQEAMQKMTGAMTQITKNSEEIQRVIKVIRPFL